MGNEQSTSSHERAAAMHPMMLVTAKQDVVTTRKVRTPTERLSISSCGGVRSVPKSRQRNSISSPLSSSSSSSGGLSISSGTVSLSHSTSEYQRKASNASMISVDSRTSEDYGRRAPLSMREGAVLDIPQCGGLAVKEEKVRAPRLKPMPNRYDTIEQVRHDLSMTGLDASRLIIAIDYTKSNRWCGEKTFGGRNLHEIDPTGASLNPYESVISTIGRVLEPFSPYPAEAIPVFGFGDAATKGNGCFPLFAPEREGCVDLLDVLSRYREITPTLGLSGPRDFAPVIHETIDMAQSRAAPCHHVLIILTSGVPANGEATRAAVVEAAKWPISIVVVGVGDGPWDAFEAADGDSSTLQSETVANFQFADFYSVTQRNGRGPEAGFAAEALSKLPGKSKAH